MKNISFRTVTVCPGCHMIGYGHPNYCVNCGRNLMQVNAAQLPDPDETRGTCSRCQMDVPMTAKYCSRCGEGLRYPYNHSKKADDAISLTSTVEIDSRPTRGERDLYDNIYVEELYGALPFSDMQRQKKGTSTVVVPYSSLEQQKKSDVRHHRTQTEEKKPSLIKRLFTRKKDKV